MTIPIAAPLSSSRLIPCRIHGSNVAFVLKPQQQITKCTRQCRWNQTMTTNTTKNKIVPTPTNWTSSSRNSSQSWFNIKQTYEDKLLQQQMRQWFGTNYQRRGKQRRGTNQHKNSEEYWDKVYQQSKEQMELMNGKSSISKEPPKEITDVLSYKVLFLMGITPLLICLVVPELRHKMMDSLNITITDNNSSNNNTK